VKKGSQDHYLPYPFSLGYSLSLVKERTEADAKGLDSCALDQDTNEFLNSVKSYRPDLLIMDVPTISFPLTLPLLQKS